jgi:3-dehydroquinate synthetase
MQQVTHTEIALDRAVSFGNSVYPYYVRSGSASWSELLTYLHALEADRFLLITETSFPVFLTEETQQRLEAGGCRCTTLTFPAGEQFKTLATLARLAEDAIKAGTTRRSCILALGGGLTGNMAGLLAALLYRGIRLVHLPTTLLAMSDSVLSLKQAVNTSIGKNQIGTFKAPEFVWNDLAYLRALSRSEVRSALCELIKNVVAICPEHLGELVSTLNPQGIYTNGQFLRFIELSISAKCQVMHDDQFEKRRALVLEYGHTVGHVLELLSHGSLPHGFAIGIGMVAAARISQMMGMLRQEDVETHIRLLRLNDAPVVIPRKYSVDQILSLVSHDNKRGYIPERQGTYPMVLLERLGRPHCLGDVLLTYVPEEILRASIESLRG